MILNFLYLCTYVLIRSSHIVQVGKNQMLSLSQSRRLECLKSKYSSYSSCKKNCVKLIFLITAMHHYEQKSFEILSKTLTWKIFREISKFFPSNQRFYKKRSYLLIRWFHEIFYAWSTVQCHTVEIAEIYSHWKKYFVKSLI